MSNQTDSPAPQRLSTGITGLDEILDGGLIEQRAYLVRGGPGTGKTTLGLHFLSTAPENTEHALFINMGEAEEQIRRNAEQIGLNLTNVTFLDLSPTPDFFVEVQAYDIFSPADVEREPTTKRITQEVQRLHPKRVFMDAMTHFRYLSSDTFQFRKQIHSFLRFLMNEGATILFTSEASATEPDDDLQFMADGIISLDYEAGERFLTVSKFRGSPFLAGRHSIRLARGGMEVFPRLLPNVELKPFVKQVIGSGIPELDELLHGGIERGTTTIISGPSGVGKTTLGMQFMKEAAGRGERSVIYTFEERVSALISRSEAISIPIGRMIERGTLAVVPIEPLYYAPNEFARVVRKEIEQHGTTLIMLDGISGYRLSMRGADLVGHLHALSKYVQSMGVAIILIDEVQNVIGDFQITDAGVSYLADNIVFLRYLELRGELRRAVGVLKKRLSDFERRLREFEITRYGIKVGKPLNNLHGILSGTPQFIDTPHDTE